MRTFSAPPATPTAPIERSITQPGNATPIGQTGIRSGLFGGGLFGGLAAGFLGAGLFGLLFGARTFRRHGRLRFDNRPAVASRAGRDCCPVGFRVVAAA